MLSVNLRTLVLTAWLLLLSSLVKQEDITC